MVNLTYRYIITCMCCFLPVLSFAQKIYEGQVINAKTEAPLADATVKLIKANLVTRTNQQGYYRLIANESIPDDTLKVSFVGYNSYLLPVSNYQPQMFIPLEPANNKLNQVDIKGDKAKTLTLDKFNTADIKDIRIEYLNAQQQIITKNYNTYPYSTFGTFAKTFEAPQSNAKLTAIEFGRRDFDIPSRNSYYPLVTKGKFTHFLLHVFIPDSATGKPGKKIFTKEVYLNDNALKITLDVKDDQIIIPTKKFFVAIEWLRLPLNQVVKLDIGNKVDRVRKNGNQLLEETARYKILYQPCLVAFVSPTRTKGWVCGDDNDWVAEEFGLNIALSATIVY